MRNQDDRSIGKLNRLVNIAFNIPMWAVIYKSPSNIIEYYPNEIFNNFDYARIRAQRVPLELYGDFYIVPYPEAKNINGKELNKHNVSCCYTCSGTKKW